MPAPVITATLQTHRFGATPLPKFSATGASGNIQWSAPYGSFGPTITTNGAETTYTPVNQSDKIIVTAKDLADNAMSTVTIRIYGTFPDRGQWGNVPIKLDDSTEGSFAADGSGDFSDPGPALRQFEYTFPGRTLTEYLSIRTFFLWHRTVKKFYIQDPQLDDVFYLVKFTNEFGDENPGRDDIDITGSFKEQPY